MSRRTEMTGPGSSGSLKRPVKTSLSNHPELRQVHCLWGILDSLVKKKAPLAEPEPRKSRESNASGESRRGCQGIPTQSFHSAY